MRVRHINMLQHQPSGKDFAPHLCRPRFRFSYHPIYDLKNNLLRGQDIGTSVMPPFTSHRSVHYAALSASLPLTMLPQLHFLTLLGHCTGEINPSASLRAAMMRS